MAKQKENFLDYTPRRNANLLWRKKGTLVEVDVEHRGFINKIAQKFFHRPHISHIALDEFGSFIWPLLDGTQSVEQIGRLVKDHFGEKAEPLYERLCSYLKTLHREGFIVYENKISSRTDKK
ncbi:MAG: PqqD family protein [Lachnospiraceae bacterium]|nr:PqqD family protein [Lachnospiraceae bacterium]